MASYPEFQALNRFHLPVIRAMQICLRGSDMGNGTAAPEQSSDPSVIQEGGGIGSIPGGLQIILDGKEGPGVQRDAPELLAPWRSRRSRLGFGGLNIPGPWVLQTRLFVSGCPVVKRVSRVTCSEETDDLPITPTSCQNHFLEGLAITIEKRA